MHKVHSVKYNFIMNFILTASGIIFPLITFPYVTRVIGMEKFGAVSFVTNVINFTMIFAQLGIPLMVSGPAQEFAMINGNSHRLSRRYCL